VVSGHPGCFGASPTTSVTQINATSGQLAAAISAAIAARTLGSTSNGPENTSIFNGPEDTIAGLEKKGMAAGDKNATFNTWITGTANNTEQYYAVANNFVTNESDIVTGVLGADYALSPTMIVGLSLAMDGGDGFWVNASPVIVNGVGRFESKGYLMAPYFGMLITNELAADVSIGFGQGDRNMDDSVNADADRIFAAANLSYSKWMGNAQLTGKFGYLHAEEKYDDSVVNGIEMAGTGAKNKMDQLHAGVQAGYWMKGVMPYVGLTYVNDVNRSTTLACLNDPIDKDAFQLTLGANYISLEKGITAGLAYSVEELRSSQENNVFMANFNYKF
jgi:hypothetical protein